ncbi:MAG: AraC family transcriptional regulator [Clostridia bacterium]|jgi:AraC-like DNA-binding protein|nr:AraC family transcriptional regulator [Clostridia bacterium]
MILSIDTDILPKVRFIGSISYKTPWIHFPRIANEYILYIIKSGELYIKEDEKEYVLKKGDFFLLQPNKLHEGFKESCCTYYFVHFKHPNIREVTGISSVELAKEILHKRKTSLTGDSLSDLIITDSICYLPKYYHIESESILLSLFHNLNESIDDYYKKYEEYKKIASCNLLKLLIIISREYATTEIENSQTHFRKSFIKVKNIIDYINKECHKKLTSQDIENIFESNYDYLNRVFHSITGYTILNYLNIVRINKAKELIESTSMNFSEIGYLVGIDNPYYFSKLFKKYTGMTPTEYLKKTCIRSSE